MWVPRPQCGCPTWAPSGHRVFVFAARVGSQYSKGREALGSTTAARSAATAAATAGTAPATTPIVVAAATRRRTATAAGRGSHRDRRAFHAVEVRLILFVELLARFFVEVVAALNEDGALIRFRLTLVELVTRTAPAEEPELPMR